ncbi:MAG TPA: serine/threonine-protein kinase [Kofleriaceae bacterium]|nr:serine/threonine-protein kinase [Kofleriaceae bacterium]
MSGVDPLIGRNLDGRYTIADVIGRGGMGTVYRGLQHAVGRPVAIKVVTPRPGADPSLFKRFLREAKLTSKLQHPNAVSIVDFGQTPDDLLYLVMEFVDGRTLEETVAHGGKLDPARVVRIGTQICAALQGAHALQIIHRDLKPANIMLHSIAGQEMVKVLDFGLAKSLGGENITANVTSAGDLLGTPQVIAPESVTGGIVDARVDLYSLGCTLYFAAMGRLPFESKVIAELITMHAMEPPPPLTGVPVGLAAVIEKLLAKAPTDRYVDAAATSAALEGALAVGTEVVQSVAKPTPKGTMLGWVTPPSGTLRPTKPRSGETPVVRATPARVERSIDTSTSSPAMIGTNLRPIDPRLAKAGVPQQPVAPSRGVPIAWAIIALVILASGGLVLYTLLTR